MNKQMAQANGQDTSNPVEVVTTQMLNWATFAASITSADDPKRAFEEKMKLISTTFNFKVTPNPDKTRPYEQQKNDNFTKLRGYVLKCMEEKKKK